MSEKFHSPMNNSSNNSQKPERIKNMTDVQSSDPNDKHPGTTTHDMATDANPKSPGQAST